MSYRGSTSTTWLPNLNFLLHHGGTTTHHGILLHTNFNRRLSSTMIILDLQGRVIAELIHKFNA